MPREIPITSTPQGCSSTRWSRCGRVTITDWRAGRVEHIRAHVHDVGGKEPEYWRMASEPSAAISATKSAIARKRGVRPNGGS
jgi:hypothetical protein